MVRAGDRFSVGVGVATALPTFDFETYSEAGYLWVPHENKWRGLEGSPGTKRGLSVVGVRNYVMHPSFEVLLLSWDLLDSAGNQSWSMHDSARPQPRPLLEHVARGGLLEAFNVNFEWTVWNFYCCRRFGWPPLDIRQLRCAMAKGRAWGLPGGLEAQGDVVDNMHPSHVQIVAPTLPAIPDGYDDDIPF